MKLLEQCTLEAFIESVSGFGCAEIVIRARAAMQKLETKASKLGRFENGAELIFQERLGHFINFFERGIVSTTRKKDALLYRELSEVLVQKRELGQDVLDVLLRKLEAWPSN